MKKGSVISQLFKKYYKLEALTAFVVEERVHFLNKSLYYKSQNKKFYIKESFQNTHHIFSLVTKAKQSL